RQTRLLFNFVMKIEGGNIYHVRSNFDVLLVVVHHSRPAYPGCYDSPFRPIRKSQAIDYVRKLRNKDARVTDFGNNLLLAQNLAMFVNKRATDCPPDINANVKLFCIRHTASLRSGGVGEKGRGGEGEISLHPGLFAQNS